MTTTFVGRFNLTSVTGSKTPHPNSRDPADGYTMQPVAVIEMRAVKDGSPEDILFGEATPYGEIKASIQNPPVASALADLWSRYLAQPQHLVAGQPYPFPKFEVTFRLIEDER